MVQAASGPIRSWTLVSQFYAEGGKPHLGRNQKWKFQLAVAQAGKELEGRKRVAMNTVPRERVKAQTHQDMASKMI